MKLIKHMPITKRILLGALSLLAIGLLAACGGYNQTTTQAQNALSPNTTPQTASLPLGTINNQPQAGYPDPTNQSALPASVKVMDKGETVLRLSERQAACPLPYVCMVRATAISF